MQNKTPNQRVASSNETRKFAGAYRISRFAGCLFIAMCGVSLIGAVEKDSATAKDETSAKTAQAEKLAKATAAKDAAAKKVIRNRRVVPKKKGEISFDDILFEMEEGAEYDPSMITKEIKALENKTSTIRGWILPASVFQQVGIKQFVLVRDNQECCFGPGAALYDCIMIKMAGDASATFSTRPVAVKGKFKVTEEYKFDGKYLAIYKMDAIEVK